MFSENPSVFHGSARGHGWSLKSILQSRQEPVGTGPRGVREVVGSWVFGSQDKRVQRWESAGDLRAGTWAVSGSDSSLSEDCVEQGLRGLVRTFESCKCQDRDALTFSDRDAGKACICELEAQIPAGAGSLVCGCGDTWRAQWGGSNTMGSGGGGGPRPGEVGNQESMENSQVEVVFLEGDLTTSPRRLESPGKLVCGDSAVWTSAGPVFL